MPVCALRPAVQQRSSAAAGQGRRSRPPVPEAEAMSSHPGTVRSVTTGPRMRNCAAMGCRNGRPDRTFRPRGDGGRRGSHPGAPPGWEPDDNIPAQVAAVLAAAGAEGTAERHVGNLESVLLQQAFEAEMLVVGPGPRVDCPDLRGVSEPASGPARAVPGGRRASAGEPRRRPHHRRTRRPRGEHRGAQVRLPPCMPDQRGGRGARCVGIRSRAAGPPRDNSPQG